MSVQIREARPGEEELLLPLVADYYAFDELRFEPGAMRAALRRLLADPALGTALLARVDETLAGYAIVTLGFDAEFGGTLGTLTDLFVRGPHRRSGIGRLLLERAEAACLGRGAGALQLQVLAHNRAAAAFYGAAGFETLERVTMVKRLGEG